MSRQVSRRINKSVVSLGVSLALGLVVTYSLVPPTLGPVGVLFNVGTMLLWSLLLALPCTLVPLLYVKKYLTKKYFYVVDEDGQISAKDDEAPNYLTSSEEHQLPSAVNTFAPIVLPILLILISSIIKVVKLPKWDSRVIVFFGCTCDCRWLRCFLGLNISC